MSEFPEFRVVRQTEYGPIIRRVRREVPSSLPVAIETSVEEVLPGREVQESEVENEVEKDGDEEVNLSRRSFLSIAAATAGVAGVAMVTKGMVPRDNTTMTELSPGAIEQELVSGTAVDNKSEEETIESVESLSSFEKELAVREAHLKLRKDEVLITNRRGEIVGPPVKIKEIIGERHHKDGRLLAEGHVYSPGRLNSIGVPIAGVDREWLEYVKATRQAEYPDEEIAGHLDVVGDFNTSFVSEKEPGLAAKIARGEVVDYKGIVEHYANKETIGGGGLSRIEYVQNEMDLSDQVLPEVVRSELRRIVPGICAQESKFNNGLVSRSGARGIFQIMPEYWEHFGGKHEEYNSLKRQVEIAGEYFEDLYSQLMTKISSNIMQKLRSKFSDEESFQRDLVVPLLINSYNAGAARVGEGVKQYFDRTPLRKMPDGKDVFIAIADSSLSSRRGQYMTGYGPEAREYVPKVYAWAKVLQA